MQYGTYTPPRDWTDAYLDRHHMYTRATPLALPLRFACLLSSLLLLLLFMSVVYYPL